MHPSAEWLTRTTWMAWLHRWATRHRRLLALGAALGLLLALALDALLGRQGERTLPVYGEAPAFVLTDQFGRTVHSAELRGTVVVANFIYTSCRDVCPLLTVQMRALQERLRQDRLLGNRVRLLSFTVDPARDTPAVLRSYAERHQTDPESWRFLTGPEAELIPLIVSGFRLGVQALPPTPTTHASEDTDEAAPPYEVMHSGRFVLIDRLGRIRAYYDGRTLDLERVLRDIRRLLKE
jgi:protein SCO1/2